MNFNNINFNNIKKSAKKLIKSNSKFYKTSCNESNFMENEYFQTKSSALSDISLNSELYMTSQQYQANLQQKILELKQENENFYKEVLRLKHENTRLNALLKNVNEKNSFNPASPPPPPPPPPSADIYKQTDSRAALNRQIAKNKGLAQPRTSNERTKPKLAYEDELFSVIKKRGKIE